MIIRLLDLSESPYMLSNKSFFFSSVQESITRQEISLSASPAVLNHCNGGRLCFKPKLESRDCFEEKNEKAFVYNGVFAQCYLPILTNLSHLDRLYWPGFGGCVEKDK